MFSFSTIVPPKIVPFSFGDEPSNFGDSASIQCSVTSGDFPIDIVWYLNGKPIDKNSVSTSKVGKRINVLNIDSVDGYHAGNYTCVASNLASSVNHTALLIVNGICFSILLKIKKKKISRTLHVSFYNLLVPLLSHRILQSMF